MRKIIFITLLFTSELINAETIYLECKSMSKTADWSTTYVVNFSNNTVTNSYRNITNKAQITPSEIRWTESFNEMVSENSINRYTGIHNFRFIQGGVGITIPNKCETRKDRKF